MNVTETIPPALRFVSTHQEVTTVVVMTDTNSSMINARVSTLTNVSEEHMAVVTTVRTPTAVSRVSVTKDIILLMT